MQSSVSEQKDQNLTATRQNWHLAIVWLFVAQVILGIILWIGVGLYLFAPKHAFSSLIIALLLCPILPIVVSAFFWLKSERLDVYMWISVCSHTFCFIVMLGVAALTAMMKHNGYGLMLITATSVLMGGNSVASAICTFGRAYELKSK